MFVPVWLAYGHSFAVEKDQDQVMSAYFKASQLMAGCHFPQLYIKLEYSLTNNTHLAEKFFSQAPNDPPRVRRDGIQLWSLREGGQVPE